MLKMAKTTIKKIRTTSSKKSSFDLKVFLDTPAWPEIL